MLEQKILVLNTLIKTHADKSLWMQAIHEEMRSLQENHTCELVKFSERKKALKNKWVIKLKKDGLGKLVKPKY